ncbi:hypothetical protein KJ632_01735 [Patescibacteria group bacterium]|nr:hypothetical protein [Patescibacteria group bacterium]
MKKILLVLVVLIGVVVFLVGCGKTDKLSDEGGKDLAKNSESGSSAIQSGAEDTGYFGGAGGEFSEFADFAEAQQEIMENYDENDPEAMAKMMEVYADYGAKMELKEFEDTEAVDAPSDFPSDLIYSGGKITQASDSSDEEYISKDITIETTDDFKSVKDFYKNLFSQSMWQITSQSSESGGASYEVTNSADLDASVYIESDPYSKIVAISISYSGYIAE